MKKNILIVSLLFIATFLFAQAPESFKYQTVVRDIAGQVIQNQNISFRISIQQSTAFTDVYVETQNITTNSFGLANLEIGSGTPVSGNFSSIDWGADASYIQVEIDTSGGSNYQMMGLSQLLSVPYALYAKESGTSDSTFWHKTGNDLYYDEGNVGIGETSPTGRLVVKSDTTAAQDDVIFSVLNAHGDTVLAVYQEGVRIWVADDTSSTKAISSRGGFAVGGFTPAKGLTNDYLYVTPDSVRIYIEEGSGTKAVGNRGGFAVGGFTPAKSFTNEFLRVTDDSSRIWTNGPAGFEIEDLATGSANYFDLSPENYFIGHNAGANNTSGMYNSFLGYNSGFENSDGEENIFIGFESGFSNTNGSENVFLGNGAGYLNTTGIDNVFIGNWAGYNNDSSAYNVFIGNSAGETNISGSSNVFIGDAAGESNTNGNSNVFIGDWSGASNQIGEDNIFMGDESGWSNVDGSYNVFIGASSGYANTSGMGNVFLGDVAGYANTSGESNIFLGSEAGYSNTLGSYNLFLGAGSGFFNIDGEDNVFLGQETGYNIANGSGNIFIGSYSGNTITTGDNNLFIGIESGYENLDGDSNIFIGNKAGYSELGSNLLYIDNSDTTAPLIHGDFIENKVTINDILNVAPRATAPLSPAEGDVYVNSTDHHIYCHLNGIWVQLDN